MNMVLRCILLMLMIGCAYAQQPPAIVEISPRFWQKGVSPALKGLSVTFDQPMRQGFSSWLGESGVLPDSQLESANSEDGKIFTLKASFKPGKVYVFALNEVEIFGVGFQTKRGKPLPKKYLVFQTSGNPGPDDSPPMAISTNPAHNSQELDPTKVTSLTVNFDKPMRPKKHGLHLIENAKPVDLAKVSFRYSPDGKTFSLDYRFKPSTRYEVVMNSTEDIGFAATNHAPLWPVRFAFTTGQPR